mmetsp:Transcript_10801/g.24393  ORF Transcript_10801/g.24393 Transcript_10801/m.24393 type:complete len:209 (-) Transcript_10801:190-816(-)
MKTSRGSTGLYPPAVAPANGLPMLLRLFAISTPVVLSRPRRALPIPVRLRNAPAASVRTTSALRGGFPSSAPCLKRRPSRAYPSVQNVEMNAMTSPEKVNSSVEFDFPAPGTASAKTRMMAEMTLRTSWHHRLKYPSLRMRAPARAILRCSSSGIGFSADPGVDDDACATTTGPECWDRRRRQDGLDRAARSMLLRPRGGAESEGGAK